MFGISNTTAKVDPQAFGERGQAHLIASDRSHGTGNGTLEGGAAVADHYSQSLHDRHDPNPYNSTEASNIQQMNDLRKMGAQGIWHK